LGPTCGPNTSTTSCCASSTVPGGQFFRNASSAYPATVSDFRLDVYEVTVGRFRRFVSAYNRDSIAAGSGKNPNNPSDPGWDPSWTSKLPVDESALRVAVTCDAAFQSTDCIPPPNDCTWTQNEGSHENLPMNCLSWYTAFAFCIWDGGRLPTEAEWEYAAAGGSEQRVFPWSSPPANNTVDDRYAVYCGGSCSGPQNVGSKPLGNGKWGHADMGGNVWEWTLDLLADPQVPCNDCANLTLGTDRVFRGGGWFNSELALITTNHAPTSPDTPIDHGVRCARAP